MGKEDLRKACINVSKAIIKDGKKAEAGDYRGQHDTKATSQVQMGLTLSAS